MAMLRLKAFPQQSLEFSNMIKTKDALTLLNKRGKKLIKAYDLAFNQGIQTINKMRLKELDDEINDSIHLILKETGYEVTISFLINNYYNASCGATSLFNCEKVHLEDACYNEFIILTLFGAKFSEAFETSIIKYKEKK